MNRNRNRAMEITVIMVHNDDDGCSKAAHTRAGLFSKRRRNF